MTVRQEETLIKKELEGAKAIKVNDKLYTISNECKMLEYKIDIFHAISNIRYWRWRKFNVEIIK